jgi:hypothetical protein
MTTPREAIIEKARNVVAGYAASKGHWNPAASLSTLLRQMKREYEDRFLYELVQNAYDAHPVEADGETSIVLTEDEGDAGEISILLADDEGDHGVLYVANRGNPFAYDNFEAICELAQSNKTPDESIGNKGVGFKSVLQVCDWPEIYSRYREDSPSFDGYCFTFARPEVYPVLAGGDEELAEALLRDVAPYFLPVPLDDQPPTVLEFAGEGFATVIRLPLRSDDAFDVARDRIERLESESVPIHLFLRRLRNVRISRRRGDELKSLSLTRHPSHVDDPARDPNQRYELVDLAAQGEWFVASRRVRGEAMAEAIRRSVVDDQLDESWLTWKRDTWVAVAVRTDGHAFQPRMYTYLPMEGGAGAPLHGHLHAPFSTNLSRTSVSAKVHVNTFLLNYAATAATATALTFSSREDVLPPTALVDLVAWDSAHHDRVTSSFEQAGVEMKSAPLVPIQPLADGRNRGGFDTVYSWLFKTALIDAERLARDAEAELVAASITGDRLGRLERYCQAFFNTGFVPSAKTRGEWITLVAHELHARRAKPLTWDRFYADLAAIFHDDPAALRGRAVLLGDDGQLHASPTDADDIDQPYVFFPPARERTDEDDEVEGEFDLKPPASLRKRLVLMSEDLTWNQQDGRVRRATPARRFLADNKLVKRFKTVDLLEHVGRALAKSKSKALSNDALRFAFNLYASTRNIQRQDLLNLRLRVPCVDGKWIPATQALFGPGWGTPSGRDLADLIRRAAPASTEVASLGARLLAEPEAWPVRINDRSEWRTFLSEIGVRDGLWPTSLAHGSESYEGQALVPAQLARRFGLREPDTSRWVSAVLATPGIWPNHPYTQYRAQAAASVLPGQADYEHFDAPTRAIYATLILQGLGRWSDRLQIVWSRFNARHRSAPDPRTWPSPIRAFLETAEWMPTSRPADTKEEVFVRPSQAWFFSDVRGDGVPNFSPLVTPEARRLLSVDDNTLAAVKRLGLGDWRDPDYAPRLLRHLAGLVESGSLSEGSYLAFRNALEDAWLRATEWDPAQFAEDMSGAALVVARSDVFVAQTPAEIAESEIYLLNERGSLSARILESSGVPVISIGHADAEQVKALLTPVVGDRVTTLGSVNVEIVTESGPFAPTAASPRLADGDLTWLTDLLWLVLEAKRVPYDTSGARRRAEIVDKLRRVRVCHLPLASITVGGVTVGSGGPSRRAVPVDDPEYPTLVWLEGEPPNLSASDGVIALVPALSELLGIRVFYQSVLELALERLRPIPDGGPTRDDYARMLDLAPAQIAEVFLHLGSPLDSIMRDLAPVVAYFAGVESGHELLSKLGHLDDEAALTAFLGMLAPEAGDPSDLVSAARAASSIPELRRQLGLNYARFNQALRDMGEPYEPIWNRAGHQQALQHYLEENRERILAGLRARFLRTFRSGSRLDRYVAVRELGSIGPEEQWLDDFDIPPDAVLESHVQSWIARHGEDPIGLDVLEPLAEVRKKNRAALKGAVELAAPLVEAWGRKNEVAISVAWSIDSAVSSIVESAAGSGALDFDVFSELEWVPWLARYGFWPGSMPVSLDASELGLTEADLVRAKDAEAAARQERVRQQGIVNIDGEEYSADRDGYDAIVAHVLGTVTHDLLSIGVRTASLARMPEPVSSGGGGSGGGKGHSIRSPRLSKEQAAAIGLVGETVAYAWLGEKYPGSCSPASWKSSYREAIGEPPGNDTLGYDFEIVLKSRTVRFEVKATTGTDTRFELGESEVGAARDCVRSARYEYRVLFISEALDSERRSLFVLPNPMDPANASFFRFPGSGLTCTFKLNG